MSAVDLTSLRRIAEAADADGRTWEWQGGYPQKIIREGDVIVVADCFESPDAPAVFAEHIATFDPPMVLWLLDLIDSSAPPQRDEEPA